MSLSQRSGYERCKKLSEKTLATYTQCLIEEFQGACKDFGSEKIPIVVVTEEAVLDSEPTIVFIFSANKEFDIKKAIYSKYVIETGTVLALKEISMKINIAALRLEHCNLTAEQVEILSTILQENPTIEDASVSGNPNLSQNHYLLLKENKLLSLSLKFCNINSEGMERISNELSRYGVCNITYLNLASNSLYDEGAVHVANSLRINRTIKAINLADNRIRDVGCAALMAPLQSFILTHEEIVVRRRVLFDHCRNQLKSRESSIVSTSDSHHQKPAFVKRRSPKQSRIRLSSQSDSIKSRKSSKHKSVNAIKKQQPYAEAGYHPFVQDSFEVGQEIGCTGNDIVFSMNLSYNQIGREGLRKIIMLLSYQKDYEDPNKGISRLIFEGNAYGTDCQTELSILEDLLVSKLTLQPSRSNTVNLKIPNRKRKKELPFVFPPSAEVAPPCTMRSS